MSETGVERAIFIPELRAGRVRLDALMASDAARLSALGDDPAIARMMSSIRLPFTADAARARIEASRFRGRPGFRLAIRDGDGALVGEIGLGPEEEPSLSYWIGRAHWGRGLAGAAVAAFLPWVFGTLAPRALTAEVYGDNPASVRTLTRAGFRAAGSRRGACSPERAGEAELLAYRLSRADREARA